MTGGCVGCLPCITCCCLVLTASVTLLNSLLMQFPVEYLPVGLKAIQDGMKLTLNFIKSQPITATTMVTNPLKLQS